MTISASEYAILASAAYARNDNAQALEKITTGSGGRFKGSDYEILEGDKDYKVFMKIETGEVVVACRGTNGVDDIIPDVLIMGGGLSFSARARKIVKVVHNYKRNYEYVSVTGHSLGGKLAANASVSEDVFAVTFNQGSSPIDYFSQKIGKKTMGYHYDNILHFTNCMDGLSTSACLIDNEHTIKIDTSSYNPVENHKLDTIYKNLEDDDKYTDVIKKQRDIVQGRLRGKMDIKKIKTSLDTVENEEYKKILDHTYYDIRNIMARLARIPVRVQLQKATALVLKARWDRMVVIFKEVRKMYKAGGVIDLNNIMKQQKDVEQLLLDFQSDQVLAKELNKPRIWEGGDRDVRAMVDKMDEFDIGPNPFDYNDNSNIAQMDEYWRDFFEKDGLEWTPKRDGKWIEDPEGLPGDVVWEEGVREPGQNTEWKYEEGVGGGGVSEASSIEEKEIAEYLTQDFVKGVVFAKAREMFIKRAREMGIEEDAIRLLLLRVDEIHRTIGLVKLLEDMGMPQLAKGVAATYQMGGALANTVTKGTVNAMRGIYKAVPETYIGGKLALGIKGAGKMGVTGVKSFLFTDSIVIKLVTGGRVLIQTAKLFKFVAEAAGWIAQIAFVVMDVVKVTQDDTHIQELKLALKRGDKFTSSIRWKLLQGLDFAEYMRTTDVGKAGLHGAELVLGVITTIFAPEFAPVVWGAIAGEQISEVFLDPYFVEEWHTWFVKNNYGEPPSLIKYIEMRDRDENRDYLTSVSTQIMRIEKDLPRAMRLKWGKSLSKEWGAISVALVSFQQKVSDIMYPVDQHKMNGMGDTRYEELSTLFSENGYEWFDWGLGVLAQDKYIFNDMMNNGTDMKSYEVYCKLGKYAALFRGDTIGEKLQMTLKRNDLIRKRDREAELWMRKEDRFLDGGGPPQGDGETDEEYDERVERWSNEKHRQDILDDHMAMTDKEIQNDRDFNQMRKKWVQDHNTSTTDIDSEVRYPPGSSCDLAQKKRKTNSLSLMPITKKRVKGHGFAVSM